MKGKKVLISGANSGIGKATALELAQQGATIYMVCRNQEKAEAAQQDIIQKSNNPNVFVRLCDFSSQQSIHEYGRKLQEEVTHLDVLINNAGAMFSPRQETEDGLEKTFAINHVGYFLNTHYCLPLLRKGSMKRIVTVASISHRTPGKLDFDDLQTERNSYEQMTVYGRTKLFNIYFSNVLAEKFAPEGITSNALHPGVIKTNFGKTANWWMKLLLPLGHKFMMSPSKGSETSVFLASSPKVEGISGKYFYKKKAKVTSTLAQNKENAQRIWDMTMNLCGIEEFGMERVLVNA